MCMQTNRPVITVLGSAGGVARAVLALLHNAVIDAADPIHRLIRDAQLHLVDRNQESIDYYRQRFPALRTLIRLHQFNLTDLPRLRQHLQDTGTQLVLDLSWADTLEMLRCCNALGVAYINTALENRSVDDQEQRFKGFPMIERIRIFENAREDFTQTTAIVCSGMNPGVVQWMALELMKKHPDRTPLGCYIVEHDSSFLARKSDAQEGTLYTTWAPACFLDEAIQSYPMLMRHGTPHFLYDPVYGLEFKVRLGRKEFYGCLMPHEEVFTLCRLYDMEGGFLYRINEHSTRLIRRHLEMLDDLWDCEMEVLDPAESSLEGGDLVGVLLVFEDRELYMYNFQQNRVIAARFGVNATYFQVACGVYGALATLLLDQIPRGVHYVDHLLLKTPSRYGEYLSRYLGDCVIGENPSSDGLLHQRMRRIDC